MRPPPVNDMEEGTVHGRQRRPPELAREVNTEPGADHDTGGPIATDRKPA
jgi:hypothetical protein